MNNISTLSFLTISCSLIFLGMGMHHLMAQQPYDELDFHANEIKTLFGLVLVVSGLLLSINRHKFPNAAFLLLFPVSIILLHSTCKFIEAGYVPEQLVEFATKIFLPLVLLKELRRPTKAKNMHCVMKLIVAMTFIGHGIFAMGFHYVPASFIQMTQSILGLSIQQSYSFLFLIGVLDVFFALLLFFKHKRFEQMALVYLIAWGTLTSLARFVYPLVVEADFIQVSAGFAEMVYRLPHGLLPFWLILKLSS